MPHAAPRLLVFLLAPLVAPLGCGSSAAEREAEERRRSADETRRYFDKVEAEKPKPLTDEQREQLRQEAARDREENAERDRQRRQDYVDQHPDRPEAVKSAILQATLAFGMTTAEVREFWLPPKRVNRTINRHAVTEQWVFGNVSSGTATYLYFTNDELTAVQD